MKIIVYVSLLLLLSLVGYTIFTQFSNFELTGEGYYLYVLLQGRNATFLSPFYLIFHYVGKIFGHKIIGYRLLNLFLLLGSHLYLGWSCYWFLKPDKQGRMSFYSGVLFTVFLLMISPKFLMLFIMNRLRER